MIYDLHKGYCLTTSLMVYKHPVDELLVQDSVDSE